MKRTTSTTCILTNKISSLYTFPWDFLYRTLSHFFCCFTKFVTNTENHLPISGENSISPLTGSWIWFPKEFPILLSFCCNSGIWTGPPRKTGVEFFWKWPLRFQPLDGHILEGLVLFTEVEINKEQKCPGHGCEEAPIAEIAKCDASHCRLSIVEGPFSITWKRVKTHFESAACYLIY